MVKTVIVDAERLEEVICAVQCRDCPIDRPCNDGSDSGCRSQLLDYLTETIKPQAEEQ